MQLYFLFVILFGAASVTSTCIPESGYTPCPRCTYLTQDDLDRCYIQESLNFGIQLSPARPFGALIIDTSSNLPLCYGAGNGSLSIIMHGELAAFLNCTYLYPSPVGNDLAQPGVAWGNATLYTSAEPCPMCMAAAMWEGVRRVVWGTNIPRLASMGSKQIMIRARELAKDGIIQLFKTGYQGSRPGIPYLKGGVLQRSTDTAFFSGFGFPYPSSPYYDTKEDVFHDDDDEVCNH